MRDNSKRVSAAADSAAAQPAEAFSFATPTEIVELPSKGRFYPPEHPLHNEETIEIKYMTAKEEDILTSPALLKKGVALDRLIQNVILDKDISVDTLLSGDKSAIMIASRINGFGAEYRTKVLCPSCSNESEATFDLSEVEAYYGDDYGDHDVASTENGTFIIKTPVTKLDVEVRLLNSKDESYLVKRQTAKNKSDLDTSLSDMIRMILVSVNGQNGHDFFRQFIEHLPAADSRYIRAAYSKLVPAPDMRQNFVCPSCSHEEEVEIPMSVGFFWVR